MQETVERLLRMGQPQEEVEKRKDEIQKSAAENAVRQIQLTYLLEAIGQQHDLKVTEDDINERLEQTARVTGLDVERVREYYNEKEEGQSLSRLDRLRLDVLDEKSLDYALSRATIKEKDS
jgi:FKBP-type peptidyl-prolyl cis-trans isomerase (trigger factor)